jgi:hypothetical protein
MSQPLGAILGFIAGKPYIAPWVTMATLPFVARFDQKAFFVSMAITQTCHLGIYFFDKMRSYEKRVRAYESRAPEQRFSTDNPGFIFFELLFLPWRILGWMIEPPIRPQRPIIATLERGIAKAVLFGVSYGIMYLWTHIHWK